MQPRAVPEPYPLIPLIIARTTPTDPSADANTNANTDAMLMLTCPLLIHDSHTGSLPTPSKRLHRHSTTPDGTDRQMDIALFHHPSLILGPRKR